MTPSAATLRPYVDDDLDRLIEIIRMHLEQYVTRHIGPWERSEEMLREAIPVAPKDVQVVEIVGEIAGFFWVELRDDCLYLEEIHIIESARGRGLGRRLMEEIENRAKELGRNEIQLSVFSDSPEVRFYQRFGYSKMGENLERHQLHMHKTI